MVPHRSLNFTWHHFTLSLFFHRFSSRFCAINLSFHFINFSSVLPWCYSISPVCLTLFQMHLPQSLQLHCINGFARFLHGFFSVLLLHSGHTSKLQFFHCFSIVSRVLYAIMVPHRSHFTIISPILSTVSPRVLINFPSVLLKFSIAFPFFPLFYVKVPPFFHCFSHHFFLIIFHHFPLLSHFFPIVLCHIPSFFLLFFSSFSPPLQSAQIHLGGRTRGESIPQRHPIATWYITLKKFTCGHLFYHLISSFLAVFGRSAPRPP